MTENEQKQVEAVIAQLSENFNAVSEAYATLANRVIKEGHKDWIVPQANVKATDNIYPRDAWFASCKKLGIKPEYIDHSKDNFAAFKEAIDTLEKSPK